jgi:hypothetical protein
MAQQPPGKTRSSIPLQPLRSTNKFEVLLHRMDWLGKNVCGDLWGEVCASLQDAISLAVLLSIPNLITKLIAGKEFKGFDVCLPGTTWWSTDRYICFIMVAWDMSGWIVLSARMAQRFFSALKGGKNAQSP